MLLLEIQINQHLFENILNINRLKSIWTTPYSPYDGCKLESIKSAINRSPFADKYKPSTELMLPLLATRVHRRHPNDISLKTKKYERSKCF